MAIGHRRGHAVTSPEHSGFTPLLSETQNGAPLVGASTATVRSAWNKAAGHARLRIGSAVLLRTGPPATLWGNGNKDAI